MPKTTILYLLVIIFVSVINNSCHFISLYYIQKIYNTLFDGIKLVKEIPVLIEQGFVKTKKEHNDRKYIVSQNKEIVIKLDFDGVKQSWLVSTYFLK